MRGPSATSATTRKGRRDGRRDPWLRFSEAGWHANGSQSYDQARVHPLHRSSAPHRVSLVAAAAQTLGAPITCERALPESPVTAHRTEDGGRRTEDGGRWGVRSRDPAAWMTSRSLTRAAEPRRSCLGPLSPSVRRWWTSRVRSHRTSLVRHTRPSPTRPSVSPRPCTSSPSFRERIDSPADEANRRPVRRSASFSRRG
jgi:hypothetical protein